MKRPLQIFQYMGLWLLLSITAFAQTGTGSVKGKVTSNGIVATTLKGSITIWSVSNAANPYKNFVELSRDGSYELKNVPEGKYYLWAWIDGIGGVYYENTTDFAKAKLVEVTKDKATENINFVITPPPPPPPAPIGSISGKMLDKNGAGVKGYLVLYAENGRGLEKTTTNEKGVFTFKGVAEGAYFVEAIADGMAGSMFYKDAVDIKTATAIKVAKDQAVTGIDFVVKAGGAITGNVTDADGKAIQGVSVTVKSGTGRYEKTVLTTATGEYKVSGLPEDKYLVSATSHEFGLVMWYKDAATAATAQSVEVKAEATTAAIDFKLPIKNTFGSVSGTVTDANGQAYSKGGYLTLTTYIIPNTKPAVRSFFTKLDEKGNYKFDKVPAGNYVLMLQPLGELLAGYTLWYDNTTDATKAKQIEVKENADTGNINFKVSGFNGAVSGVIRDAKDTPIEGATVSVQGKIVGTPTSLPVKPLYLSARTDKDGKYSIKGLPDGAYTVNASACIGLVCKTMWFDGAEKWSDAKDVVVANGATTPTSVDIKLPIEKGTAVISGIVKDAAGAALAEVLVTVAQNSGASNSSKDVKVVYFGQAYTDKDGKYSIGNLPKGDYIAWATYAGKEGKYAVQWFDKVATQKDAKPISLTDAQTRSDINFTLDPQIRYATLEGTLADANGAPIFPAFIELLPKASTTSNSVQKVAPIYLSVTDKGAFAFRNIAKGEYTLKAYGNGIEVSYLNGASFKLEGNLAIKLVAPAPTSAGTGSISGKITSQVARGPITAISIATDLTTKKRYVTVSNNYEFVISGLPNGKYNITTLAPGHVTEFYDDQYDASKATILEISATAPKIEGLDINLRAGASYKGGDPNLSLGLVSDVAVDVRTGTTLLAGVIRDNAGKTITNATVYAIDENDVPIASAQSDNDGSYQMEDLPSGTTIKLFATKIGYTSTTNDNKARMEDASTMYVENGTITHDFMLQTNAFVANEDETEVPASIELSQNYPNPFNPSTTIRFALPQSGKVQLEVFDLLGRRVALLADASFVAGVHEIRFQAADLPSGTYVYRLQTEQGVITKRMTLVK